MRWIFLALLALVAAAGLAIRQHAFEIPERWNPWSPLRLEAPPDAFSRYRLHRLSGDPALCRAFLATTPLRFTPLPDRVSGDGCGFENAVRIDAIADTATTPFSLSCRSAASLALWWHHTVLPQARERLGTTVTRLEHFGSYACRNVYNRDEGARSRHAVAEAFDISGLVLAGGRRIRVVRDWSNDGQEGPFLQALRDGACRWFDGVFSPDYNAAHRDHLHVDRGPYRSCR